MFFSPYRNFLLGKKSLSITKVGVFNLSVWFQRVWLHSWLGLSVVYGSSSVGVSRWWWVGVCRLGEEYLNWVWMGGEGGDEREGRTGGGGGGGHVFKSDIILSSKSGYWVTVNYNDVGVLFLFLSFSWGGGGGGGGRGGSFFLFLFKSNYPLVVHWACPVRDD